MNPITFTYTRKSCKIVQVMIMIKNENIFLNILYVVKLEPTISILTVLRYIQRAQWNSVGYRIRKYITLKSVLFIMFANLKLVLRRYTNLYGMFYFVKLYISTYSLSLGQILHI